MNREDAGLLRDALNGLAEVYDKKPVSVAAIKIWFETLKEFSHEEVFTCLGYWAQNNEKFPTPAAAWKQLNERRTRKLEAKAEFERKSNLQQIDRQFQPTEYGRKMMREIVARFGGGR